MKFSINRQKTIEIIGEYSNILKDNPVKPSLAGLFIQAKNNQIVFKGANTEIELIRYANCEIESEGQVLIKPALLLEYIKLLDGENINFENAMKFINYIHRPDVYAKISDTIEIPSINKGADELVTKKPLYDVDKTKNAQLLIDIGDKLNIQNKYWQEILIAN